jgi:aminoglycoside phosphotransferase (APT) family kinase protein
VDQELLDRTTVEHLCTTALGRAVQVGSVQRLRGGTKKGVFRVTTTTGISGTTGTSLVLYVWHEDEDWWSTSTDPAADVEPFTPANGMTLLTSAYEHLTAIDVRVPVVLHAEHRGADLPADCAVVEDVTGRFLETMLDDDAASATPVLAELKSFLLRMAATTSSRYGKVADGRGGEPVAGAESVPFHEVVLQRALRHLNAAAVREPRLAAAAERVEAALHQRAAVVQAREGSTYSLVHGELGPDHVLIDATGRPVLIDLEGLMWADVEWEHAFLEMRFHEHYEALRIPDLDGERLQLYRLALHLSLVEGPLRLIDTGFPDVEFMAGIAEHNLGRVLSTTS